MAWGTRLAAAAEPAALAGPAAPQAVLLGEPADRAPVGAASAARVAHLPVGEDSPAAAAAAGANRAAPVVSQADFLRVRVSRHPAGCPSKRRRRGEPRSEIVTSILL
jgi:hypothetical protein